MEQLNYNFLFRWFVGVSIDDPVWDATVFTRTRERLLAGEVAHRFFAAVLDQARKGTPAFRRALHDRRHLDRGVGGTEELQAQRPP